MSSKRLIFPAKPFYFSVEIRPAVARRSDTASSQRQPCPIVTCEAFKSTRFRMSSHVFPCANMTRKSLPAVVLCVSLAASCESARQPTSPSPTPGPTPTPAPGPPVAAENMITLPAPTIPPTSAADPLVGRYTLEIVVARSGLRCEMVPEHVRRRIYTADIHPFRDYYAVKLYRCHIPERRYTCGLRLCR